MKTLLFSCLSLIFLHSNAQDKNQFFALDANMNQTVLDSSKYLLWVHEKEDGNWQWDYYQTWGPLIKSQNFADHDGTILNGRSSIYNKSGNLDSTGIYDHGKKQGSFYKCRSYTGDSLKFVKEYVYDQDSVLKTIDLLADSINEKEKDTIHNKESEYTGGKEQWIKYLKKNLRYPERAVSHEIQGHVRIVFTVNKEGDVLNPYIEKSREYSLDLEALRIINHSGKWVPGIRDGEISSTYKIQLVNYRLETQ